jgi:thioredoxin-related protein
MRQSLACFVFAGLLISGSASAQEAAKIDSTKDKPSIYNAKLDAREQVKTAAVKAARNNQRILLMFGGDWCGWCHKLHSVFQSDKDVRKVLSDDFQLVMVDTKAPHAEELLAECQGDVKDLSYPFLAVLDANGKVLTRQNTEPLEEGDHHNPVKVRELLAKWAPEKQDAEKVLAAAMSKASSEDKMVFLHFGAPWCGWCHKLEDFLARDDVSKILSKDFIDVKIDEDRMIGGKDVEIKVRKDTQGGIPWFVFLDSKGAALINSDAKTGNIGYPAAPEEIAHFVVMLKNVARKIDASDIEGLEKILKADPAAQPRPATTSATAAARLR